MSWISNDMLPVIFLGLMGIAMLLYAILDGYDLGIGMLMVGQSEQHRDSMIASIGPFWDASSLPRSTRTHTHHTVPAGITDACWAYFAWGVV